VRAQFVPDFPAMNDVVGLLPKLCLGKLTVEPAIANDAVFRGRFAREII
jgi:hypothetical protein